MQLLFIPMQTTQKKVHWVVLVYVLLGRLPPFCVFNVVVGQIIIVFYKYYVVNNPPPSPSPRVYV